jgi:hypothetical protein
VALHLLTWLFGLANEKVAVMRRMSAEAVWAPACASAVRGAVRAIVAKARGRLPAGRKSTTKGPRDDLVLSVVASADDKTNNKLLRKLLNTPSVWEYVEFDNEQNVPNSFHYIS